MNVLVHKPPPTVPFNYASVVKKKRKAANLIKDELQKEEVAYRSRRFGPAIEVTLKESGTKLRIKQNVEIQKVHVAITHVNEKHLQSGNGQEKEVSRSKPVAYANPRGAALHLLYKLDLIEKHGNM